MSRPLRWGFVGSGTAAGLFADGLRALPGHEIGAVVSRRPERARTFASRYGVPRVFERVDALVSAPHLDAIYVATPHALHRDHALAALGAGRPTLVEKPFALDARQADEVIDRARSAGLFAMEALWTRFLPTVEELLRRLRSGAIGRPRLLTAHFGIPVGPEGRERFFDPANGAGALLDLAPYPVFWATELFGPPVRVEAVAVGERTRRIDEEVAASMVFEGGEIATFTVSLRTETSHAATVYGTHGRLEIPKPFYGPTVGRLVRYLRREETGGEPGGPACEIEEVRRPAVGNGYGHQAAEVADCLRRGRIESDRWPLDRSRLQTAVLDAVRRAAWNQAERDDKPEGS